MRTKKLTSLFMLRLSPDDKEQLERNAVAAGLTAAEFARLSLRAGAPIIQRKLPQVNEGERA